MQSPTEFSREMVETAEAAEAAVAQVVILVILLAPRRPSPMTTNSLARSKLVTQGFALAV